MPQRVARELRNFATEVHQLAYETPHGQGEYALLQLAQRMNAEADKWLRHSPTAMTQAL
jgi:hypothetical protein